MSAHIASKPVEELTARECELLLYRKIEDAKALIKELRTYVDTVEITTERPCTNSDIDLLRQTTTGGIISTRYVSNLYATYMLCCHQPTSESYTVLNRVFPKHTIYRFEIACDFVVDSEEAKQQLSTLLAQMLTQPWHGRRETTQFETTLYFGPRNTTRNMALYDDRPSKVSQGPVVHLEFRYRHAGTCRRRGVNQARDLVELDLIGSILRDGRLSIITWKKADKIVGAWARRRANRLAAGPSGAFCRKYLDRRSLIRRVQYCLSRPMTEEESIREWVNRGDFEVQRCVEVFPPLQAALIHAPLAPMISHINRSIIRYPIDPNNF